MNDPLPKEIVERLEAHADSGAPRGADAIWDEAVPRAGEPGDITRNEGVDPLSAIASSEPARSSRRTASRRALLAVSSAAVVFTAVAGYLALDQGSPTATDEPSSTGVSNTPTTPSPESSDSTTSDATTETQPTTDQGSGDAVVTHTEEELNQIYIDCVDERGGGSIDYAQLLIYESGFIGGFKGPDVPAEYHAPCFAKVGGATTPDRSARDAALFVCQTDTDMDTTDSHCIYELLETPGLERPAQTKTTEPDATISGVYLECVRDQGLEEPELRADVFLTGAGKLMGLETSVDVPAPIHGYCYSDAGGVVLGGQSSNDQTWILDCGSREPSAHRLQEELDCRTDASRPGG